MRRIFSVLVSVAFVFSLSAATFSAEKAKLNMAAGAVKTIDVKTKTVTIRADKQPDFTFSINDETVLKSSKGQKVTIDDIRVGVILVLMYDVVDGKNIAKSVTVAGVAVTASPEKKG